MSRPVGIVVVSHSRALADAAVGLAREMATSATIAVAAGLDDGSFGTDAVAIAAAIGEADAGAGVVVLMDLGSAVLSAELALEFVDDPSRVLLCPAPLVEGLVVAAVAAAGGADRATVAAEAAGALAAKEQQLGVPAAVDSPVAARAPDAAFTVTDEHGLHARPAARLVTIVGGFDADVRLRNATTGSDWVPARSLTRVATLGALRGHRMEVAADGPDAGAAVAALLAEFGDDTRPGAELPRVDLSAPASRPLSTRESASEHPRVARIVPGEVRRVLPLSPGVAVGPAHRLDTAPVTVPVEPSRGVAVERTRLDEALDAVRAGIAALPGGEILAAHLVLLDDPDLAGTARTAIDGGASAPRAWADAVARTRDAFAGLADPYLAGRAADVDAVGEQVLRALVGAPAVGSAPPDAVLVATDLTPAQAAAGGAGVVLAGGAATSHAAILLRGAGVPAVGGAGAGVLEIPDGTVVALDGTTGELVTEPAPGVVAAFEERATAGAAAHEEATRRATEPALTRAGIRIEIGVNAGSATDVAAGVAAGADLVGLLRTEFLFLGRPTAPDVDEQEAAYRAVAEAAGGRRVVLRTLDVGGDKPLPYLPVEQEANPFLGLRGLRLALARPGVLATQLIAAVRVARDAPLSIMFPMVATVDELLAARAVLDAVIDGDPPTGLRIGMMVEVPAAALAAGTFAPYVDFFSIGTNDLVQYALAAERGNPAVAHLADPLHPGVLALVDAVCRAAGDRTVAVCGEAAAEPRAAEHFVALGVRELSVAAPAVPVTKQTVRAI